jgi:HlyD family secretion protein
MVTPIRGTSAMDTPIAPQRPRWRRRALIAGGVALALVLLAFPFVRRWWSADRTAELSRLRLGSVTRGDLVHDVAAQGRVVAASRPTLFSPAPGIVALRVKEGQTVAAGETLAVVSSPEIDNRLAQERASADSLRSDLGRLELELRQQAVANQQGVGLVEVRATAAAREVERSQKLSDLGLINQVDLARAKDELSLRQLELEQARQGLANGKDMFEFQLRDARARLARQDLVMRDVERQQAELTLRAPFAGQVATLSVENADAVVRGQPIVGVVDLSDLEVEVAIPESYADDVAPGVPALVRIDSGEFSGKLASVAPEVRNAQVEGRIAFDGGLPPGLRQNQRVSARLVLDRRTNVLKVPRGPFVESGGGRVVYVVADGLARRRNVTLGAVSVTEVEIVDGLAEGEQIVVSDIAPFENAATVLLRP